MAKPKSAARAPVSVEDIDTSTLGQPLMVKLSRIQPNPEQPRKYFDSKTVEELADNIEAEGQRQPVIVCKHSEEPGMFVLIGGERRWRAFQIIEKRTGREQLLKCYVDAVHNEKHYFRQAFLDNLFREDLVPVDEAAGYAKLYADSHLSTHAEKIADIARTAGRSIMHVEGYIKLHGLPEPVKKLLHPERPKDERLGVTAAIEIARSTFQPALQVELAKEALERNYTVMDVRGIIARKTGKPVVSFGGRTRRPSEDYQKLRHLLLTTRNKSLRARNEMNFDGMYENRIDEEMDRKTDASLIRQIIANFEALLKDVQDK